MTDRLTQIQASRARLSRANGVRSEAQAAGEGSTAELWLYGVVGGFWFGFNAESVARELRALDVDEITVRLHSPGGNAIDGIAIGNLLRNHRARVTVVVDGMAASAASVVALGGDEIVMSPGSQVMIHDASLMTYGNAAQLRSDADWIDKQSQNYAAVYAGRAGGTAEEWRAAMTADNGEGTWYTAEEAVSAGLADRIGTVAAVGSPPVTPVEELDDEDDEAAALAAWDLEVLIHPAARAAWRGAAHNPPAASAGGSTPSGKESAVPFSDEQITQLRNKLGVAEDADEATIMAALDEVLDEQTENSATLPEGMAAIEADVLAQLRADAQAGREARQQQRTEARDRAITEAIDDGRITPARRDHWQSSWDADPEGTAQLLAGLEKGLVPMEETGHAGTADAEDDSWFPGYSTPTTKEA